MENQNEIKICYKIVNDKNDFVIIFKDIDIERSEKNAKLLLKIVEKVLPMVLKTIIEKKYVPYVKNVKYTIVYVFSDECSDVIFGFENLPFKVEFRTTAWEVLTNALSDVFFHWYAVITTGKLPKIKSKIIGEDYWKQFEKEQ